MSQVDTPPVQTGTILDRKVAQTLLDLRQRRLEVAEASLQRLVEAQPAPLSLRARIQETTPAVIAEVKRASPSRGRFPVEINPAEVAAEYLAGGASAISVLTDQPFFQGSLADLAEVAAVAHDSSPPAPVLRKDFMLESYQVLESRAYGADAVLLIVAILNDERLRLLLDAAGAAGMDALVEVHDETEMARALAANATLIGVNNRDLRSFAVDLHLTERLAPLAPPGTVVVSESGIRSNADMRRLTAIGVHAVLVGESLIIQGDPAKAVRALRGVNGSNSRNA
ncbi:MAG: indole-3-glycerol phosphate synthase TrpC [Chloroflexia bacterium]|nr:indole-3-glycerol phosphate synthase TrpC [Chloroflexia bacterium]